MFPSEDVQTEPEFRRRVRRGKERGLANRPDLRHFPATYRPCNFGQIASKSDP